MGIAGCDHKQSLLIGNPVGVVAQDAHGGGPSSVVFCFQETAQEFLVYAIKSPANPKRFQQVVLVTRIIRVQGKDPGAKSTEHLIRITTP